MRRVASGHHLSQRKPKIARRELSSKSQLNNSLKLFPWETKYQYTLDYFTSKKNQRDNPLVSSTPHTDTLPFKKLEPICSSVKIESSYSYSDLTKTLPRVKSEKIKTQKCDLELEGSSLINSDTPTNMHVEIKFQQYKDCLLNCSYLNSLFETSLKFKDAAVHDVFIGDESDSIVSHTVIQDKYGKLALNRLIDHNQKRPIPSEKFTYNTRQIECKKGSFYPSNSSEIQFEWYNDCFIEKAHYLDSMFKIPEYLKYKNSIVERPLIRN